MFISMSLPLDVLWYLRCVHCAVFFCTDSKRLISLMLFGSQSMHIPELVWQMPCRPCISLKRCRSSGFFTTGPDPACLVAVDASLPGSIWGQHDAQAVSTVDGVECLAMQCTGDSVFSCFQCTCWADARISWVWCSYLPAKNWLQTANTQEWKCWSWRHFRMTPVCIDTDGGGMREINKCTFWWCGCCSHSNKQTKNT